MPVFRTTSATPINIINIIINNMSLDNVRLVRLNVGGTKVTTQTTQLLDFCYFHMMKNAVQSNLVCRPGQEIAYLYFPSEIGQEVTF